jgi:hypothetical protein
VLWVSLLIFGWVFVAPSTWPGLLFISGNAAVERGWSTSRRGQGTTIASGYAPFSDTVKYLLPPTFRLNWKRTHSSVTSDVGVISFTMLAFFRSGRSAITPILPFLFPIRALPNLSRQPAGSMYDLTIGIGGIGIIWDFDLERLDVVVLVVEMVLSCNSGLDNLGDLVVDCLVDDRYQYSAETNVIAWLQFIRFATCV